MCIDKNTEGAIDLYKKLVLSGDALSGYQLYDIYSKGMGVQKDETEAQKWSSMAQKILETRTQQSHSTSSKSTENQDSANQEQTLESLLHESGALIERGAREKNAAIAVGLAGGGVGGIILGIGLIKQTDNNGQGAIIAGGAIMGASAVAALVVNMIGNRHIKKGGELMRRVQFKGNGVSVSF